MSRTTTALKRLGVPGLAAVTLVAGLPLFLGTAQAAHIQGLNLSPESSTDNVGVCVPYTVQLQFTTPQQAQAETVDVTLTEGTADANTDVDFCTAPTGSTTPSAPQGGEDGGNAGTTDRAEFTTDANGRVTFGVISNRAGTVDIRAFYETDNNNTFNAGEFTDTSVQTFSGGGTAGSNQNQDAANFVEVVDAGEPSPATGTVTADGDSDNVVEGETRTYRVFVGSNASGVSGVNGTTGNGRLAGVTVSFSVDSNVNTADRGSAVFGVTDNNGIATGTITFPARTEASGTTSTDTVTFFVNQTGVNSTPGADAGEPRDTLTVTVSDATVQQNRTLTLSPESRTISGGERAATFTATVDDTRTTGADAETAGTLIVFGVTGGSGNETITVSNQTQGGASNECTTQDVGANSNDSTCVVTVNDPDPVVGQVLTVSATVRGNASASDTSTLTFVNRPQDARFIALTPETVTVAPNTAQQLSARVTDVDGNPVAGVVVRFTETGPGAFRNGSSSTDVTTNANGVATVETISLPGETGTQTVTATIQTSGTQCNQAAGQGQDPQGNQLNDNTQNPGTEAAGVCSDSSTVTFGNASPSPSPSPSPSQGGTTPPPSPSPGDTQSPVDCSVTPTVTLERDTIIATGSSGVRVNAPANSVIDLLAYSRPSTTYRVVRSAEIGANGIADFRIVPPTNTRLYAQIRGCDTDETRFSVVLNVRTLLTLFVERNGTRDYTFSGRALPARNGGLIVSLYRVTNDGRQILTSQTRADASTGRYVINRRFTGTGRFGFVVRTGQDLQNAPGSSNVRSLLVF